MRVHFWRLVRHKLCGFYLEVPDEIVSDCHRLPRESQVAFLRERLRDRRITDKMEWTPQPSVSESWLPPFMPIFDAPDLGPLMDWCDACAPIADFIS